MGLDLIGMVMDVEDRFGLRIPDAAAERITTVGGLYVYLLEHSRRDAPIPCPTSRAFYRLRRTLTAEFGVSRTVVRPRARLRTLFPPRSLPAVWPQLTRALGLTAPPDPDPQAMSRRMRVVCALLGLAGFGFTALGVSMIAEGQPGGWGVALILGAASVVNLGMGLGLLRPGVHAPTIGDLAAAMAADSLARDADGARPEGDPGGVWDALTAIVSKHTGVPAADVRPGHRFIDLGV